MRYCGDTTVTETTPGPEPTADPESPETFCANCGGCCSDSDANCPVWAAQGYCEGDNAAYMEKTCEKSCKYCENNCTNTDFYDDQCDYWVNSGYCESNEHVGFMKQNCGKACCCRGWDQLCKCELPCVDHEDHRDMCPQWADIGDFCYHPTYGPWMMATCKKSCKNCDETAFTTPALGINGGGFAMSPANLDIEVPHE